MKTLTVFTPTFNRGYILSELYNSLLRQTSQDFEWLIIDDGSSDDTKDIVRKWQNQNLIPITYVYQKNMGMVAAHNTAHYNINTELNVCIDSDDYMPDNGVELIVNTWKLNKSPELMGLVGLDSYKDGRIIGNRLPDIKSCKFSELLVIYKVKGDKKYVLRTDLIKQYLPYPFFEGEKFPAPSYLYLILEQQYKFMILNEVLCVVEYLPDGNSMNKIKQYKNSPNAFACYRIAKMKYALNYKERFKNAIHYVASKFLAKKVDIITGSPFKITTVLAMPFGFIFFLYLINTKKTAVNKSLNK